MVAGLISVGLVYELGLVISKTNSLVDTILQNISVDFQLTSYWM